MRFTIGFSVNIIIINIITLLLITGGCAFLFYSFEQHVFNKGLNNISLIVIDSIKNNSMDKLSLILPNVMHSSGIIQIDIVHSMQSILHIDAQQYVTSLEKAFAVNSIRVPLSHLPNYSLSVEYINPTLYFFFSSPCYSILLISLLFLILLSIILSSDLKNKLLQMKKLEIYSRQLLTGTYDKTKEIDVSKTWPNDIALAMNNLVKIVDKNRKEISRLSSLIHIFVMKDAETGVSSALAFQNLLKAKLEEENSHGLVLMIRLADLDQYRLPVQDNSILDKLQEALISVLSYFTQSHSDSLLARYFNNDFVILLPNYSSVKEVDHFASEIISKMNIFISSTLTSGHHKINTDALIFIGATAYYSGQTLDETMESVSQATRIAELNGYNGWFIYDDTQEQKKDILGSVRWQTLLNNVLNNGNGLVFYREPVVTQDGKLHHSEITPRICTDGQKEILASEFMPWIRQLHLASAFDRYIINCSLPLLVQWPHETLALSINVESLFDKDFTDWLSSVLKKKGQRYYQRLLLQLQESDVERYLEKLIPIANILKNIGCNFAVVQAGASNMSSVSYIQKLPIKVIKLYTGLVRHINTFPENRLIVDSFCSTCIDSDVEIFASGIKYNEEWNVLMEKGISGGQGVYFAPAEIIVI